MSATTEYVIDDELSRSVDNMIQRQDFAEFSGLRKCDVHVTACFAFKSDKDGNSVVVSGAPVKLKKVPEMFRTCMTNKPHFVLVVCHHTWAETNDETKRSAMIHEALWQVDVTRSNDGTLKIKNRKPDVITNSVTLTRFGAWNQVLVQVRDSFKGLSSRLALLDSHAKTASSTPEHPNDRVRAGGQQHAAKLPVEKQDDPDDQIGAEDVETPRPSRRARRVPVNQEIEDDEPVAEPA